MRWVLIFVGVALLAVAGFSAGRWVGGDRPGTVGNSADPAVSPAADPVEALLSMSSSGGSSLGVGWIQKILLGDLDALEAQLLEMDVHGRTALCLEVIARMDAATMRALVDKHFRGRDFTALESWFVAAGEITPFAFADRWAEIDPEGMLAYTREVLSDPETTMSDDDDEPFGILMAYGAVMSLAKHDPEAALEIAKATPSEMGEELLLMAVGFLARTDPARALETAESLELDADEVFGMGLSPSQAAAALPAALALEDEGKRTSAVAALVEQWAERDPEGAFGAALKNGDGAVLKEVVRTWAERDPLVAITGIANLPDEQRESLEAALVGSWAAHDPLAAIEWAEGNMEPDAFQEAANEVLPNLPPEVAVKHMKPQPSDAIFDSAGPFSRFVSEDPAAALAWLAEQPPEILAFVSDSSSTAGKALGMRGAGAVRDALAVMPSGAFRTGTIASALEFVGYNDPEQAKAIATGLSGAERAAALEGLAMGWAERDPQGALDFLETQGDRRASDSALGRWALMDPPAAHGWLSGAEPSVVAERIESVGLANAWAHRDPAAAGEAMLALPEADAGQQLGKVLDIWAIRDPLAASAFINDRLEPGHVRDSAVLALVGQIRERDPGSAAEWAGSIEDPDLRARALAPQGSQ